MLLFLVACWSVAMLYVGFRVGQVIEGYDHP
jgi:hypothetical protein